MAVLLCCVFDKSENPWIILHFACLTCYIELQDIDCVKDMLLSLSFRTKRLFITPHGISIVHKKLATKYISDMSRKNILRIAYIHGVAEKGDLSLILMLYCITAIPIRTNHIFTILFKHTLIYKRE